MRRLKAEKDAMNFVLYMLGRAAQRMPGLRPGPRQQLIVRAATAGARGDLAGALAAYRTLTDGGGSTPLDILIRAQLHLMNGEMVEAALHFAEGLTRLHQTRAADPLTPTALEKLFEESDRHLAGGRYARATGAIRRARALLEVLLAAEAGLWLTRPVPETATGLQSLAHLSDLTLRLLARAQIADNLAVALRERHISESLAPAAASTESVNALLEAQRAQLAPASPGHMENLHRLGLVCRALGHTAESAAALRQVLALHPQHVASAVRLAAADSTGQVETLRRAYLAPAETLALFARFAAAAQQPGVFDDLGDPMGDPAQGMRRANLAFALSEMALLDETRMPWCELTVA